ncbi:hypothetical protein V2J09_019905, partial [Rumex salicifolius]
QLHTLHLLPNVTVSKDGTGNFSTVNQELLALPKSHQGATSFAYIFLYYRSKLTTLILIYMYTYCRFYIYIKEAIYNEYVTVTKKMTNISMYGDGPQKQSSLGAKITRTSLNVSNCNIRWHGEARLPSYSAQLCPQPQNQKDLSLKIVLEVLLLLQLGQKSSFSLFWKRIEHEHRLVTNIILGGKKYNNRQILRNITIINIKLVGSKDQEKLVKEQVIPDVQEEEQGLQRLKRRRRKREQVTFFEDEASKSSKHRANKPDSKRLSNHITD